MNHYIYIIHTIRFLEQNEPTYKIGKTTTNIFEYLPKKYKKTSKVIYTAEVINCHKLEREIINLFDQVFVKRIDAGLEYYSGNINKMVEIIGLLVLKEKILAETYKELPKIKQLIKEKKEYIETLLKNKVDNLNDLNKLDNLYGSDRLSDSDDIDESDTPITLDESDTPITLDESDTPITLEDSVLPNNQLIHIDIKINNKKSLKMFYKHICDTQPSWYLEGKSVPVKIIENAYRNYFEDNTTSWTGISRQLNGKLFTKTDRSNNIVKKKLVTYMKLKTLY